MASQSFRGAGHAGAVSVPLRSDAFPVEYEVDVLLNDVLRDCVGHSGLERGARDGDSAASADDGTRASGARN